MGIEDEIRKIRAQAAHRERVARNLVAKAQREKDAVVNQELKEKLEREAKERAREFANQRFYDAYMSGVMLPLMLRALDELNGYSDAGGGWRMTKVSGTESYPTGEFEDTGYDNTPSRIYASASYKGFALERPEIDFLGIAKSQFGDLIFAGEINGSFTVVQVGGKRKPGILGHFMPMTPNVSRLVSSSKILTPYVSPESIAGILNDLGNSESALFTDLKNVTEKAMVGAVASLPEYRIAK